MKLRFDSAMGNAAQGKRIESKALIVMHPNASSLMLLELCQRYLKEASLLTFKKRSFQLDDLLITQASDLESSCINLSNLKFTKISLEDQYADLTEPWGTASAKEDAKDILELKTFADLAVRNG